MIYGIGDLHLDYTKEKKMCVFGDKWKDHEDKIFNYWKEKVTEDDLVLLPGDISWGLKLEDGYEDLKRIDVLPGRKVLIKGNHDYWWQSYKKINTLDLKTMDFIQNNAFQYGDLAVYGTRGWNPRDTDGFTENDEKIFKRELNRLDLSLSYLKNVDEKIVMIHYPPFNIDGSPNEFVDIMKKHGVKTCVYGHLHAEGHKFIIEGEIEKINFYCLSSDYIDFKVRPIEV